LLTSRYTTGFFLIFNNPLFLSKRRSENKKRLILTAFIPEFLSFICPFCDFPEISLSLKKTIIYRQTREIIDVIYYLIE